MSSLNDKIVAIEDKLVSIAQTGIATTLAGLKGIALDTEMRYLKKEPPYLHIIIEAVTPSQQQLGIGEIWDIQYRLMVVASPIATSDRDQQRRLALLASSLYLTDHSLGNTVSDTRRIGYVPNDKKELANGQLFGASVLMVSSFHVRED